MKVLLSDGDYKHTLGIARSLSSLGHQVDCIGSSAAVCAASRAVARVVLPSAELNDLGLERFLAVCRANAYDLFIPIGGSAVDFTSRNFERIREVVLVILPSRDSIATCLDKWATLSLCAKVGVPAPRSWFFSDYTEFASATVTYQYPMVVKGSSELDKTPTQYVNNDAELDGAVRVYRGRRFPILQSYVSGVGVGFFALYKEGQLLRYFMHKRLRENPPTGGAATCAISIYDSNLLYYGRRLLDSLSWHGVAMVEFKLNEKTGELHLMEINPKFWGSHDLAIASGANFAQGLTEIASGQFDQLPDQYRVGVRFQWPLDGDVEQVGGNPSSLLPVLRDLFDPRVRKNIHLTDPVPSLVGLKRLCGLPYHATRRFFFKHYIRSKRIGIGGAVVRGLTEWSGLPWLFYSRVTNHLYVGMQHGRWGRDYLVFRGFTHLLSLRSEFDDETSGVRLGVYLRIPIDEYEAPTLEDLKLGSFFIFNGVQSGGKVYIHCREGVSRAPLFAAAYLVRYHGQSVEGALSMVAKHRFFVNILPNQLAILNDFAASDPAR